MRRPTFLILGSPKCGTTALSGVLSSHPDVFLSRPKEPHFFDCDYRKGFESYVADHFATWKSERAAGEATPSYLSLPFVPERIHRELPAARLIAILRHPVERAYSSWWMFHVRGMEPLSFEDAIRENELRLARGVELEGDGGIRAWSEHVRALRQGEPIRIRTYLDGGHYASHLNRYFACFPREQLRIVFSEALIRDRDRVVRELWRFLGVADNARLPAVSAVNEAIGFGARPLLRFARATGLMRLRHRLPDALKASVKTRLSSLGRRPPLTPATRQRLLEYFEPHTRELERLLSVELPSWRN
jgi:hypothetical protein